MSNKSYPEDGSWILIPKKQGLALYVSWRQNKVQRREKYFLVNCYWSSDKDITDSPGTVSLWVADVYFEGHFADEHELLKGITSPKEHIYKFDKVGDNWATAKLDNRFQFGQDKAYPNTTFRWVVYHPQTWEPKQADFGQSAFTSIAAGLVTSTAKSLTSTGLKIADPSGILNAGAAKLVGWEKLEGQLHSVMNSFGNPLRRFGLIGLSQAQEKQMAADKEEYESALELARSQVNEHPNTSHLGGSEREVYSHVMVALNLGVQGVAEEGSHHASRPSVIKPSPFAT